MVERTLESESGSLLTYRVVAVENGAVLILPYILAHSFRRYPLSIAQVRNIAREWGDLARRFKA